jgi:hypothetical protein
MAHWIKVAGTAEHAYTQDRWNERRAGWRGGEVQGSLFPRRPRIERGDRLVVYAAGSAAAYGEGRIFAIEEVVSDEPEPSGHDRWGWRLETRLVCCVSELSEAPALREIGVSAKSLRQHSHIRLSERQGRAAEGLMRRYGVGVGPGSIADRAASSES